MPARGHSRATTNTAVQAAADIMFGEGGALSVLDPQTLSERAVNTVVEKTTIITQQAKENLREPINELLGTVGRIASKVAPTALAASASVQYLGGTPSFASYLQPWNLRSKYLFIGADRSSIIGYPLERYRQLSSLRGFVMCENVRLVIPGTANASGATLEEQQLIKQYLEAGCFIE